MKSSKSKHTIQNSDDAQSLKGRNKSNLISAKAKVVVEKKPLIEKAIQMGSKVPKSKQKFIKQKLDNIE